MPQALLPLVHDGATTINDRISIVREKGEWTYFYGVDPIFRRPETDRRSFRMFAAQLICHGACRQSDVVRAFGVSANSVKRSVKKFREEGIASFFEPRAVRGATVITDEIRRRAQELLEHGHSRNEVAAELWIKSDTLRKAIKQGRLREHLGRPRGYVGDLKCNRKVWYRGREIGVAELAASIPSADRKEVRRGDERQWYFTRTLSIPGVNHKVRIVILWHHRRDDQPCKILVANRITWEMTHILRVYRQRWTGTEKLHRDGKQELGMGDCQRRTGQGQTRHMYLVMLAYTLLMRQLRQSSAKEWGYRRLTTIGEACRAVLNETLLDTLEWAMKQVNGKDAKISHIRAILSLT